MSTSEEMTHLEGITYDQRIGQVEGELTQLNLRMDNFEEKLGDIQTSNDRNFSLLLNKVDKIAQENIEQARTDPKTIIGICSLVMMLLGGIIVWAMAQQTAAAVNEAVANERQTHISERLRELDIVLQREMRLLDSANEARIDNFDADIQREIRLLNREQDTRTEHLQKQLEELKIWQRDHDVLYPPEWLKKLAYGNQADIEELQKQVAAAIARLEEVEKEAEHQKTLNERDIAETAANTERVRNIEKLIDVKASDRFTGAEGRMLDGRVKRLEDAVTNWQGP